MNGNNYDFTELFNQKFFKTLNYIDETKIFNELQNNKKILIFDFRSRIEYEQSHLENSLNIPIDEIDVERLNSFDENFLVMFSGENDKLHLIQKYKRLFIAIVLSQNKIKRKSFIQPNGNIEELYIGKILTFYQTLKNNKIRELGLFKKGFNVIQKSYNLLPFYEIVPNCNKY